MKKIPGFSLSPPLSLKKKQRNHEVSSWQILQVAQPFLLGFPADSSNTSILGSQEKRKFTMNFCAIFLRQDTKRSSNRSSHPQRCVGPCWKVSCGNIFFLLSMIGFCWKDEKTWNSSILDTMGQWQCSNIVPKMNKSKGRGDIYLEPCEPRKRKTTKKTLTFHYTGCLIGILMMASYSSHITG